MNNLGNWSAGDLDAENVSAGSGSKLAAAWHRHLGCVGCPNTLLLVYQDSNGKLQLMNATATGWEYYALSANPIPGSGLALTLLWDYTLMSSLRLYYQINTGHLTDQGWYSAAQYQNLKSTYLRRDGTLYELLS